ncbi:MAG: glycosyl hydrolase [Clostridia bacterium]|nr:glycosyl hydrolase [Clostridia bacterium]
MRHWKLYLIHHSHTDIGYTDYQEKIEMYHADYIRQVLSLLDAVDRGEHTGCEGFKWQCENIWQVENFCRQASEEEKCRFESMVREGRIGLSGNYLNMTELVDEGVLTSRLMKGRRIAERIGVPLLSAMSADVNGYAWGYPDALAKSGVRHLFCALHSHHGMFPMGHNPSFFWWEGPKGGHVLTFVGEHYHFGNELGLVPHGNSSYLLFDDVRAEMNRRALFHTDAAATEQEELELVRKRLIRYLEGLEASGYPFEHVPMMVSGVISDNAPPNIRIAERAEKINAMLGDLVHVEMATLDTFFDAIVSSGVEIPVCRGDFTDWWADGVGSTPKAVKLYREAQRCHDVAAKLDPEKRFLDPALIEAAEENMMLYAEHTWGYSSSISEPWNTMVGSVGMKKSQYAVDANVAAFRNLNRVLTGLGQVTPYPDRPHRCRIMNPHPFAVQDRATVILDHWENVDGMVIDGLDRLALRNTQTGELLPSQWRPASRGSAVETALILGPGESVDVEVCFAPDSTASIDHTARIGADAIADIAGTAGLETPFEIDTPFFRVRVCQDHGICSIFDKQQGCELIDPAAGCGAFTGVYEITPSDALGQMGVRRTMGRNRCSMGTRRSTARLTDARITESGEVYVTEKLSYALEGFLFFDVYLKIYKTIPLIEARVCMHKETNLDPENVYVALPFTTGGCDETYIDKTGCIMRPGIDQLPMTCQQFYLLQNGILRQDSRFDLMMALRDTPLVVFGPREAAPIRLCDGHNLELNRSLPYAWVMNNFWETNFEADLGGVYEFFFLLSSASHDTPASQIAKIQAMNEGLTVIEL